MSNPRTVHPLDRWTEEERTRVLAGETLRRGRPSSIDPLIVGGFVLLGMIVVGVPVMAWLMGQSLFGMLWR